MKATGDDYEQQAVAWLSARGVVSLERNYRTSMGEIDIVARDGDTLVFVEVRARSNPRFAGAAASVTRDKQRRIVHTAQLYLRHRPSLATLPCRFDVLAFEPPQSGEGTRIHWVRGAFTAWDTERMDYYQLIANNFHDTIETITFSVDALAAPIELGAALMTRCLLDDHKIIACGNGPDAALAQLFVSSLLCRFEQDRPALPALTLSGDGASLSGIAQTSAPDDIYARPLRALGQPGDVLVVFSSSGGGNNLVRAVQAARERDMSVIALCGAADAEIGSLAGGEGVELRVEASHPARVLELHTMVIHCFCQLIDDSLFGSHDAE